MDELEQEYLGNDGRIDEIESANLDTIRRNIKQFTQRIQDIERMAIVVVTNIAQVNIIIDAAVNTKTKMLQLQESMRIQSHFPTRQGTNPKVCCSWQKPQGVPSKYSW